MANKEHLRLLERTNALTTENTNLIHALEQKHGNVGGYLSGLSDTDCQALYDNGELIDLSHENLDFQVFLQKNIPP